MTFGGAVGAVRGGGGTLLKLNNPSTAEDIFICWSTSNFALAAWAACTACAAIPGSSLIN